MDNPSLPYSLSKQIKQLPPELQPPDPDSPRGRILSAARKLFSEQGLAATSTRAIAEEAGVNLAMIHYYYGNKEKLYQRTLAGEFLQFREMISRFVTPTTTPEELIVMLPVRAMDVMRKNPTWAVLLKRELAEGSAHLIQTFRNLGEFGPLGLRELFNQVYEQGTITKRMKRLSFEVVREFVIAIMFGTMVMQPSFRDVFQRDLEDDAIWKEWSETVTELLKHGILAEQSS